MLSVINKKGVGVQIPRDKSGKIMWTQQIFNWLEEQKDIRGTYKAVAKHENISYSALKKALQRYRKAGARTGTPENSVTAEAIAKTLCKMLEDIGPIVTPYKKIFTGKQHEDAVLLLGDAHIGKENTFLNPETGKTSITHNTEIVIKRFNNLATSIYSIVQLLSTSFKLDNLYIFDVGDMIDNDRIFPGQRFNIDMGVGEQLWMGVKALTDLLKAFLGIFKNVTYIKLVGNHGRTAFYREAEPISNYFEYHLGKILEMVFAHEPRIKFIVPESWYYLQKIRGWRYLLHHGNSVYSWMSLPYYGIVRQGKSRRIQVQYDIECIGHFHVAMAVTVSSKSFTIVNGSFIENDNYAWERFGQMSVPRQYFFGVSDKRPRTWGFKLEI